MAKISPSVGSLEFQANQAFASLRLAMSQKKETDIIWAEKLYKSWTRVLMDETKYYESSSNEESIGFLRYGRTIRRAALYDRYILQYLTGFNCAAALGRINSCRDVPHIIEEQREIHPLKLDRWQDTLTRKDLTYADIFIHIRELRQGCYVEPLWQGLQLVRRHYQLQK
ncbi:MAG: hypothetical protein Q7K45_05155 [Nanoarchaeota archaeon]|nr:hypothetical protein [Nanoarchaeota archaeon]